MLDLYEHHYAQMDEIYTGIASRELTWGEANSRIARRYAQKARDERGVEPSAPSRTAPGSWIYGNGTGFFVTSDGYVVTNAHVVREQRLYRAQVGAQELILRVIDLDDVNDLALGKVEARGVPIPIALVLPAKGEDVAALGYPAIETLGRELKATFGKINALSGPRGIARFVQTDAPMQPGNSGGPLLNMRGEVVGVVTATFSTAANVRRIGGVLPQNVNYAVKTEHLVPLLDRNIPGKWRRGGGTRFASTADLVRQREPSVVLIVIR